MYFIIKVILFGLSLALSFSFADKTLYFAHLSFNSVLQLINGFSRDLQKILKYFNDTAIVSMLPVVLEWFELYSIRLCVGMTKSKSWASSIAVPVIFVKYLVNRPQFKTKLELYELPWQ